MYQRYGRWVEIQVFDAMLETFVERAGRDGTATMINNAMVRAHHCAAGIKRTQETEALGRSRGSLTTKLHARSDAKGHALEYVVTSGQTHNGQGPAPLFRMIHGKIAVFLADRGYDTDARPA